jgi:hypothetical protein
VCFVTLPGLLLLLLVVVAGSTSGGRPDALLYDTNGFD